MKINPVFPPERLTKPKRRAERQVYEALEASTLPGRALYEVKVDKDAPQIDFLVWAEAIAAFAVQIKGGNYRIQDGELCLDTGEGWRTQPGLLAAVWDSSRAIPEVIQSRLHRSLYIIPVLALPSMAQNEDIRDMAARRSVEVVFGMTDWVDHLVELADGHPIWYRPNELSIEQEVMTIMPELAPSASPTPPQVVIQNVENLHIHIGPEGAETLGIPSLTTEG